MIDICPVGGYQGCKRCTWWDDSQGCRYERVGPLADHGTVSLVTGTFGSGDCTEVMALGGEVSHA